MFRYLHYLKLPFLVVALLCATSAAQGGTTVLISDDFSSDGPLNGSTPGISADGRTWQALTGPTASDSDGKALRIPTSTPQTNVIDFGEGYFASNPGIYTLSLEVTLPAGDSTSWIGIGFVANPQIAGTLASTASNTGLADNGTANGGTPWILCRQNGIVSVFAGPGATNPLTAKVSGFESGQPHTLNLVLDTRDALWTLRASVDATPLALDGAIEGDSVTLANSPEDIRYVGFSQVGGDIGDIKATKFSLTVSDTKDNQGAVAPTPRAPALGSKVPVLSGSKTYPLAEAHLFAPFWKSLEVYGEAVALVRDASDAPIEGTLLFMPEKVVRVRSSDGKIEYEEGRDFTVDRTRRRLVLTPESRIPSIERKALYKKKGDKQAMSHKAGDTATYLFYAEAWFRRIQVEVDYVTKETWNGYTPQFAGELLPGTLAKLDSGEDLKICVTGDSISTGANASKKTPPYMPGYVTLVEQALCKAHGVKVETTNLAVPGTTAKGGLDKISQVIAERPDLVLIAFGANDVAGRHPEQYAGQIEKMIARVRETAPQTEFIIVTSVVANPEWSWSPAGEFPKYREAVLPLAGPGVAIADVTALSTDVLQRKRYLDLTGNGINHPNDFTHRLYAQTVLALLTRDGRSAL